MVGVPAVWELIRKGILAKVKAGGAVKQKLFNGALSAKRAAGAKSLIGSITDAVVFKAVKEGTGGRLRWALSGGAPISRETQEFLSLALVTVLQGCVSLPVRMCGRASTESTLQIRHDRIDCYG